MKVVSILLVLGFSLALAYGQATPNAELDAWRTMFADSQKKNEEVRQMYLADREIWKAEMAEANRPLTKTEKVVAALKYAGDKAVDFGVVYGATTAAINNNGRINATLDGVRSNGIAIRNSETAIRGAIKNSEDNIFANASENLKRILAANDSTRTAVDEVGRKVDGVGGKIDGVDRKVDTVGRKVDGVDRKVDGVDRAVGEVGKKVDDVGKKVNDIDKNTKPTCTWPGGPVPNCP